MKNLKMTQKAFKNLNFENKTKIVKQEIKLHLKLLKTQSSTSILKTSEQKYNCAHALISAVKCSKTLAKNKCQGDLKVCSYHYKDYDCKNFKI